MIVGLKRWCPSRQMEAPLFSLDVNLQALAPTPMVVPDPVPNYEELASKLGLNNVVLDTDFIAMLSTLESGLDLTRDNDEIQVS